MILMIALSLLSSAAHAVPNARFSCLGRATGETVYLEGNLASPARFEHVAIRVFSRQAYRDTRDRLDGVRDATREGTRFYFRSGDVSTYLTLPDRELGGVRALLGASERQLRDAIHDRCFSFRLD